MENKSASDILEEMKQTFIERGKIYGDNYKMIGNVMDAFFPEGLILKGVEDHNRFHLWFMIMVKMTRLGVTHFNHKDSVHDIAVYAAMFESLMETETHEEI